jgi:cold shock protein
MLKGVIKSWDNAKGWGFIVTTEDEDLFFHVSDLDVTLRPAEVRAGMDVKFDIRQDMKGAKAVRVRKA